MLLEAIYHRPYREYAFPTSEDTLLIRLRTKKNDLHNVILVYHENYNPSISGSKQMDKAASDELFDYYEVELDAGIKRFRYMFYLEGIRKAKWYNADGFFDQRPHKGLFHYSRINTGDMASTPGWLKKSVIYQIFPDRFCNSSCAPGSQLLKQWENGNVDKCSFFGGNFEGMTKKIPYLVQLGIDAIYLNPIFKAKTYHRYHTLDYYTVDELLGSNAQFKEFVDACHRNSIKVILDAVFNHCSSDFSVFNDVLENGELSKYKDWFHINSFPVKPGPGQNYECFGFYGDMPKFNVSNEETSKYLRDIAAFWIENYGIDGWRFDVADEVDRKFWTKLRSDLKEKSSGTVMIGEMWEESSSWLNEDVFDSAINYPVTWLIHDLFACGSISVEQFKQKIDEHLMKFKLDCANNLVNIIGTHDTQRFLTACGNDRRRFELGVVFQLTFPGVPLIYYGDEIGMHGSGDPDCRMPMVWDERKWDKGILGTYKFLIDLRKKNTALTDGKYKSLYTSGSRNILAYKRDDSNECIVVVMNASDRHSEAHVKVSGDFKSLVNLNNSEICKLDNGELEVSLSPFEWRIYNVPQ